MYHKFLYTVNQLMVTAINLRPCFAASILFLKDLSVCSQVP